jgi:hypothetical protein
VIGETARHRTVTVDRSGTVTWEWDARDRLDGAAVWTDHVEGTSREDHAYTRPRQASPHVNDVDRLGPWESCRRIRETCPRRRTHMRQLQSGRWSVATADSWIGVVRPRWVGLYGVVAILVALGALAGLVLGWRRHGRTA